MTKRTVLAKGLRLGCAVCAAHLLAQELDPVLVARWPVAGELWDGLALAVTVSDQHAYVSTGWAGLELIHLANPSHPQKVGRLPEYGFATVAAAGSYLFVGDGRHALVASNLRGLSILESLPLFRSITASAGGLALSWDGPEGTRLQQAAGVGQGGWQDVPATGSEPRLLLPMGAVSGIFRLVAP